MLKPLSVNMFSKKKANNYEKKLKKLKKLRKLKKIIKN